MARPLRVEYPGAVYHITSRGNARGDIFADDHDCELFLDVLADVVRKHLWLCHAFCLMSNHYHLLIETPEGNLSRGMRQLNGVYTQLCNRRHQRVGHLLQGRYKAILAEKESYLLELCRYIVLNPVRAKMTSRIEAWRWSSFPATAGLAPAPEFLTISWVLSQFGDVTQTARQRYVAFVRDGIDRTSPWEELHGGILLGGETFVVGLLDRLGDKLPAEVPKSQRLAHRPTLAEIFAVATSRAERVRKAREAHVTWGYSLKDLGAFLGVHYATVSKMVKRADG